jgi:hypothetical protein
LTLRAAAWCWYALAAVGALAWDVAQVDGFVAAHPAATCGMPILGIHLLAFAGFAAGSLPAAVLGGLAIRREPAPRPLGRWAEMAVLGGPGLLVLAAVLAALLPA